MVCFDILYIFIFGIFRILANFVLFFKQNTDLTFLTSRDAFRGSFRTNIQTKTRINGQYENCSHFWDIFGFFEKLFKYTFNLCSHIQPNT